MEVIAATGWAWCQNAGKIKLFNQFTKIILFSFGPVNQKTEILSIKTMMYDMILMLLVVGKSIVIWALA